MAINAFYDDCFAIEQELSPNAKKKLDFSLEVNDVSQWSAETPQLYTLVLSLKDLENNITEYVSCRTGFRSVELTKGQMLVNGKAIIIKGVNRHEHDPIMGRTVSDESMMGSCSWRLTPFMMIALPLSRN
jgi:beta-galactosidase/beta-glucuronidase